MSTEFSLSHVPDCDGHVTVKSSRLFIRSRASLYLFFRLCDVLEEEREGYMRDRSREMQKKHEIGFSPIALSLSKKIVTYPFGKQKTCAAHVLPPKTCDAFNSSQPQAGTLWA